MSARGEKVYTSQNLNSAHTALIRDDYFNSGMFPPSFLMDFGPSSNSFQVAILKNSQMESISVFLASDHTHNPVRRVGDSGQIVYGPVSAVATLEMQEPGIAFDQTAIRIKEHMKAGCDEAGITLHENTQLTGASVVLEVDPRKQGLIHDREIQKGFGYLFSPHGPYGKIMILPQKGQQKIMKAIEEGGGKVAWQGLRLNNDYFKIRDRVHEMLLEQTNQRDVHSLLSALMGYVPLYAHLYNLQMQGGESFKTEEIGDQMKSVLECIQNHIPVAIPA